MLGEVIPYGRFLEVRDRRQLIVELTNSAKTNDGGRGNSTSEDGGKQERELGVISVRVPQ